MKHLAVLDSKAGPHAPVVKKWSTEIGQPPKENPGTPNGAGYGFPACAFSETKRTSSFRRLRSPSARPFQQADFFAKACIAPSSA